MGIMMIAGTECRRQGCSLQDGKQWGKILGDTVNLKIINFPVSFNECFGGLALFNGDPVAAAEYATITDITNTNFKIYMYANNAGTGYANANIFYLFLGAQPQWGYYVESQNPTDYRYWSIPFTSHYITMATKTYYEPKEEAVPWLVGIDMQKFICGYGANFIGSSYVSCVGIGCQPQWGYSTGGSGAWALKFNGVYTAVVVGAPGFPAREFCGFTFDYTLTGWSFTAGYNSPISYIRPTTTAISLGY